MIYKFITNFKKRKKKEKTKVAVKKKATIGNSFVMSVEDIHDKTKHWI